MSQPRVLIWDIETIAARVRGWGPRWDFKVTEIEEYGYVGAVSWTWYDMSMRTWEPVQYRAKARGKGNDKGLVKHIKGLLDEADAAVAHNGDRFDIPEVVARLAHHRLGRPQPFIPIDTRKLAKKLRLPSYRLDDIADYAGLERKEQHQGWKTWKGFENNDPVQSALFEKYSKQDTEVLAQVFDWVRDYVDIPRLNMQQWNGAYSCTHCGSIDVQLRGWYRTKATAKRLVWCKTCENWSRFAKLHDTGEYR